MIEVGDRETILRNAMRWNGEELARCSNPSLTRDRLRHIENIKQCEQQLRELGREP